MELLNNPSKMLHKLPISVIIPTMNRPDALNRTIKLIVNKCFIPKQIIVIDQSQGIEVQQLNRECLKEQDEIIETIYIYQKEPSLTNARNQGFLHANNEIIVFSDDDVDVEEHTLKNIFEIMQDGSIAMIAGIDLKAKKSDSKIGYFFYTKSFLKRKKGHVTLSMLGRYPNEVNGEVDTEWAMGYFFVVRKSLVDKWKIKWDENLTGYAYAEDLDFSYSYYKCAKHENLKCILSDKVKVNHLASKEYRIPSKKQMYMYVINREYLSYKHHRGFISRVAMRWINLGQFFSSIIKNEKALYILFAQIKCECNKKQIKAGKLYNIYE